MSIFNYWGKTADNGSYHLLPYHCLDVAAVGYELLSPNKPLAKWLSARLGVLVAWLRQWFVFCLALHDIGKFATAFQGLKPGLTDQLVPAVKNMPYNERHDSLGFLLLRKMPLETAKRINLTPKQLHTFEPWVKIVTGHHGIPPKESLRRYQDYFTENDRQAAWDFFQNIAQLFLADMELEILLDKQFKRRVKQYSWVLAGVTVLADWLGSSLPFDQYCSTEMPLDRYWEEKALPLAEKIVSDADLSSTEHTPFSGIQSLFPFISEPTPLQRWVTTANVTDCPQLFIFEDVTGAGKTEAAVTLSHRLFDAGAAEGIYVGLPTMATANAMYLRLGKAYRRLFAKESKPSLVLAHGARHLSEAFRESVGLPVNEESGEEYKKGEVSATAYCNAWLADSRKKALLAEVGVGTLDQALLGVLPARHQSLRLLGLSRKVLIVDEVHAYDPYMNQLLQTLLRAHAVNGGSAILLSATLPNDMRSNYVKAYCKGLGVDVPDLAENPPYPLVTQITPKSFYEDHVETRKEVKRSVTVAWLKTEQEVLTLIREAVEQGQCVCWIRNTVRNAREAFDHLETCSWLENDRLLLFHSRFAMVDRQRIEGTTLTCFGKQSDARTRCGRVLVATQVVEQSLDLDFDLLISDLAPIDLLIQRVGREHRHVRDEFGNRLRKPGAKDRRKPPVFYVLAPEPAAMPKVDWLKSVLPGTQAVYRHVGQLWLTQQVLLKEQTIKPSKNARTLIEEVYGVEAQNRIPETLSDLSWEAEGEASGKRGIARLNCLDLSKGYSRRSAEDSGGWDEDANIPTRLSDQTVDIVLVVEKNGKLKPYADTQDFPWDMSSISLPKHDWENIKKRIAEKWRSPVEKMKGQEKALKWVEVLPLTDELRCCYDKHKGWSLTKGGRE